MGINVAELVIDFNFGFNLNDTFVDFKQRVVFYHIFIARGIKVMMADFVSNITVF